MSRYQRKKNAKNEWGKKAKLLSEVGTRKMISEIFLNTGTNANYLRYEVKEIMTFYVSFLGHLGVITLY